MLYIVPTPIGNLKDISPRALDTLMEADFIACEDTRHTLKLLNHYNIKKPLISYHQHSGISKIDYLISLLREEKNIALVSDAGTPAISDPGYLLVAEAHKHNVQIISIPGPSAVVTALAGSGFNCATFTFLGYMPQKKGRQTLLKHIAETKNLFVVYESTHRIIKLLEEMVQLLPDRQLCVARELTKIYEEFLRGTAQEILTILQQTPEKQKGEFVVIINK